jgi:hypothetical protein
MTQPIDTQQQEVSGGAVRITAAAPAEQTRIILFYIGDTAYTVPKTIPANLGLQFLEIATIHDAATAQIWLMEELVGEEGMDDLKTADGMTPEQLAALRSKFDALYLPQTDELLNPKGLNRSSRRSRGSRS